MGHGKLTAMFNVTVDYSLFSEPAFGLPRAQLSGGQ